MRLARWGTYARAIPPAAQNSKTLVSFFRSNGRKWRWRSSTAICSHVVLIAGRAALGGLLCCVLLESLLDREHREQAENQEGDTERPECGHEIHFGQCLEGR